MIPDVQVRTSALPRSIHFLTQAIVSHTFSKLPVFLTCQISAEGKKDRFIFLSSAGS